ncbi:MAG: Crp/Fnr family transcriptional regulator [Pelagimonas sp.]|nr:Crp/Fnr family transcriptional regulator [Pelagimonas sp.]
MSDWINDFGGLSDSSRAALQRLSALKVPKGAVLFRPGETAKGFVVVLSGRVEVFLTGPTGREILLYAVEHGQSCVQSTLSLMGGEEYSGEAITQSDCELVMIPRDLFLSLMNSDAGFRDFVFQAFGKRMQSMLELLERVAFTKVEARLAQTLLERAQDGIVQATHSELAVMIGSAREVVSRRLDALARRQLVELDRGKVTLRDRAALKTIAQTL